MTEQASDIDVLIERYEAQIVAIQEAIAQLRKAQEVLAGAGVGAPVAGRGRQSLEIEPATFFRMNVPDATKKYLSMCNRRPQSVEQIQEALKRGGLEVSKESLFTILPRAAKGREIMRVGRGLWGLSEWFPPKGNGGKRVKKPARPGRPDERQDEVTENESGA
jgi:hypothetical protein